MTRLDLERAISQIFRMAEAASMEIERGEYEAARVCLKVIQDLTKEVIRHAGLPEK